MRSLFTRGLVRAILLAVVPFALSAWVPVMTTARMTSPRARLRHEIDSLTSQTEFRSGQLGVLIVNPPTGDTLYSRNAGKLFMPASYLKILTSAPSLPLLGRASQSR